MSREISVTQVRDFLSCRRKWYYRQERGLEPAVIPESWGTGTLFHAGMAGIHRSQQKHLEAGCGPPDMPLKIAEDAMLKCWEEERVGNAEHARTMIEYYWTKFGQYDIMDKILQVEVPLELTIGNWKLTGKMDLMYEKDGHPVIRDYKTVAGSVKADDTYMKLDWQFGCYMYIAQQIYGATTRMEMVRVRRDPPHALTPKGKPSKTINNPSTDYIRVSPLYFNAKTLVRIGERIRKTLEDIEQETDWPLSDDKDKCARCPYFHLCAKELTEGEQDASTVDFLFNLKGDTSVEQDSAN